ncbi:hypothetical protein [Phocaeicola plebeius]|uniref:hypothetical protein n=1 Tax=Phocaeicola plebeius TaxID=310297 RepID=UPI0026ED477F|nr:hypothetical protein [Phocaeicola plebeius]
MATKLSSITRTSYKSEVGDMELSYNIAQNTGENLQDIYASLKKGDKKLGNLSSTSNGEINISISRDVPEDIATLAFTTFISDVKQIKSELNVN